MKRILLLILVFTMLICSFSIPSYAAESKGIDQSSVEEDLKSKYSDPVARFPINTYDKKIYLISFLEYGYRSGLGERSDEYGLYLYVYNPSGKDINSDMNKVQFATSWDIDDDGNINAVDYKKYDLTLLDVSDNNALLKFKVHNPDSSMIYKSGNSRRYDISGIEMHEKEYTYEDYEVGYSYTFTGYGKGMSPDTQEASTLSCELGSILTLKVDVHQVSYLTGDSELGLGYSNQINSVYFSIPSDIEEKYGDLYSIKYEYYHYYTSPIIVTNNKNSYNTIKSDLGQIVDRTWKYSLKNWKSESTGSGLSTVVTDHYYYLYGELKKESTMNSRYKYYCYSPFLTTVFYYPGDFEEGKIYVTSDELQDYFRNYTASYHTGKVFDYSADLFDLSKSKGYKVEERTVDDENFTLESYWNSHKWWEIIFDGVAFDKDKYNEIVNASYIEKVESDILKDGAAQSYLVDSTYETDLRTFYSLASSRGDNVYLLRYALANDYHSLDLQSGGLEGDFFMAEGNVYLNFDIIYFTFGDAENHTVIAAVSDPTDGFFDVTDTTPEKEGFDWDLLLKILKIILAIFFAVLIVCAVIFVVIPVLQVVFGVTSFAARTVTKPIKKINEKRDRDDEK